MSPPSRCCFTCEDPCPFLGNCVGCKLIKPGSHRPQTSALLAQVANIVAMNASLVLISLSLNQIIRSGIPIITAILGIAIEKKVGCLCWAALQPVGAAVCSTCGAALL